MDQVEAHEQELIAYVFPKLQAIEGLTIYGSQDLAKTFWRHFLQSRRSPSA